MKVHVTIAGRGNGIAGFNPWVEIANDATLATLIAIVQSQLAERRLSASTLVFVSGKHVGSIGRHEEAALVDGAELLLLQPVAGG